MLEIVKANVRIDRMIIKIVEKRPQPDALYGYAISIGFAPYTSKMAILEKISANLLHLDFFF